MNLGSVSSHCSTSNHLSQTYPSTLSSLSTLRGQPCLYMNVDMCVHACAWVGRNASVNIPFNIPSVAQTRSAILFTFLPFDNREMKTMEYGSVQLLFTCRMCCDDQKAYMWETVLYACFVLYTPANLIIHANHTHIPRVRDWFLVKSAAILGSLHALTNRNEETRTIN